MPYLGEVLIDIIQSEKLNESSKTTDHALEDGEQITDHVENDPITLDITGIMIDPSDEKLLKLRQYRQEGRLLTYRYISQLETVLITSFATEKDASIVDGYRFSMTLKQIRLAKAPNVIRVSVSVKKQTKAVTNVGRKSVKKVTKAPAKKVVLGAK